MQDSEANGDSRVSTPNNMGVMPAKENTASETVMYISLYL
jgi:hypothetical protein